MRACIRQPDGYCAAHADPAECDANDRADADGYRDVHGCPVPKLHAYALCHCFSATHSELYPAPVGR